MNTPTAVEVDGGNEPSDQLRYRLRLYITGATSRSTQAIENIKAIGEKHLSGRYDLEVVDAYQQTDLIRQEQIVVLPTLVKLLPLPLRRMIGDLSDEEQVLIGLGLVPEDLGDTDPAR
jgi:circadian clock protein KaiB